jgi:mannose/fructose-specific phosphotransferase system component IIA
MSEPLKGVVVSHAALAQGLVDAVRQITGEGNQLIPLSNEGCDSGALAARLRDAIGNAPAVVFVDLPGGSCLQAAVKHQRGAPSVAIVAGVNLAMLLDFIYHRDLSPGDAARRAVEQGGRAVRAVAL